MIFGKIERAMFPTVVRRAIWKRANAGRIERAYHSASATLDREGLARLAVKHAASPDTIGAGKYLFHEPWLRECVYRALRLDLDRSRPLRIMDMGTGTGYFLHVCRTLGHDARGIDLANEPIYNDTIPLLDLKRDIHRVSPATPLPPGDATYDLITAFMVTFNEVESDNEWGRAQWEVFLRNIMPRVAPGGRLAILFNYSIRNKRFYDSETAALFDAVPGCRASRRGDELIIQRQ